MPECLRASYDELVNEIDREILHQLVEDAERKQRYGFQFAGKLVNAVRATRMVKDISKRFEDSIGNTLEVKSVSASRRGDETQLNVDCVLSRPVAYVDMTVHL